MFMEAKLDSNIYPNNLAIVQNKTATPLSKALKQGNLQAAENIMKSMAEEGHSFNSKEDWQLKVLGNLEFKDEDFQCLDHKFKNLVYRTANNLMNIPFTARLNSLGMKPLEHALKGPSFTSEFMDVATIHQNITELLLKLRQENRLLTKSEFEAQYPVDSWHEKEDFTRIIGCDYLKKNIEKLNLNHMKIPEKKAIIQLLEKEIICFHVEPYESLESLRSNNILIYSEPIERVDRKLSREEIIQLMTLIEVSNFVDLKSDNFIIGTDGIYFIDTEIKSFSGKIQWKKMLRLICFVSEKDQDWFKGLIDEKFKNQPISRRRQFKFDKEESKAIRLVGSDKLIKTFLFSLKDLNISVEGKQS